MARSRPTSTAPAIRSTKTTPTVSSLKWYGVPWAERRGTRVLSRGSRFANKVSRARIPAKTYCFVAGTLVLTASGSMPVEAVAIGDSVLSRDAVTGEQVYRQVTETFVNSATELIQVRSAKDTTHAASNRPHGGILFAVSRRYFADTDGPRRGMGSWISRNGLNSSRRSLCPRRSTRG